MNTSGWYSGGKGGVRVAYDVALAEAPVVTTVNETGGAVDRVSVAFLEARGKVYETGGRLRRRPDSTCEH